MRAPTRSWRAGAAPRGPVGRKARWAGVVRQGSAGDAVVRWFKRSAEPTRKQRARQWLACRGARWAGASSGSAARRAAVRSDARSGGPNAGLLGAAASLPPNEVACGSAFASGRRSRRAAAARPGRSNWRARANRSRGLAAGNAGGLALPLPRGGPSSSYIARTNVCRVLSLASPPWQSCSAAQGALKELHSCSNGNQMPRWL